MMRILVTGATGFIGAHFVQAALSRGHRIAALTRDSSPPTPAGVERLRGDMGRLPWREVEQFAPQVCLHAAWVATPGVYLHSEENRQWLDWSLDLLRGAGDRGARHAVVLGTCAEYLPDANPLSEEHAAAEPGSPYARCKAALRLALDQVKTLSVCWARIFYPYGVGEHPDRLCSSLIRKLARHEPARIESPGSIRDYIHVRDVAAALLLALEHRFAGALNVGTGVGVPIGEIGRIIAGQLHAEALLEFAPRPTDAGDKVVAEAARLRQLGWQPTISLERGVRELVQHLAR
jgi:nucleoside-diphosphate-sugar epimerase